MNVTIDMMKAALLEDGWDSEIVHQRVILYVDDPEYPSYQGNSEAFHVITASTMRGPGWARIPGFDEAVTRAFDVLGEQP